MPLFSTFGAASLKGFSSGAAPLLMDALIIAGGGGGDNGSPLGTANGGGGAGGYREFTELDVVLGNTYTVTVGAGGLLGLTARHLLFMATTQRAAAF